MPGISPRSLFYGKVCLFHSYNEIEGRRLTNISLPRQRKLPESAAFSGRVQDLLLLCLKFLFGQNTGFSQFPKQLETGKLLILRAALWLLWLLRLTWSILSLPLLSTNQIAQSANEQIVQQATAPNATEWQQGRSSQPGTAPVYITISLHGSSPSPQFQEMFLGTLVASRWAGRLRPTPLFCYTYECKSGLMQKIGTRFPASSVQMESAKRARLAPRTGCSAWFTPDQATDRATD